MLIVMPETTDSSVVGDTEWANTSRGRFASGVIDLVRSVDSTWPTVRNRAGRAIAGLSMGGYGAVNIALRHLSLFSVVESWSGYFTQTPTGPFAGATPAQLWANSPAAYVHTLWSQLTADPIHMLLYISRTDPLHVQQGPFRGQARVTGRSGRGARIRRAAQLRPSGRTHMALALSYAARWLSGGTG